jgi:hypothetical protein
MGNVTFHQCPSCSGQMESVAPVPHVESFYEKLPAAFAYPFTNWGWFNILLAGIFYWMVEFAMMFSLRAMVIAVPAFGYLGVYLINIANRSGDGDDELPEWPPFSYGLVGTFFLFAAINLFSFLPVIAYALAMIFLGAPFKFIILPLYLTLFFLPMATLRVAMFQTTSAMNPIATLRSIFQVPTPYMVACLTFFLLLYVRIGLTVLLDGIPLLGGILESIIGMYLLFLEMRILGLIYYAYQDRLDWFSDI